MGRLKKDNPVKAGELQPGLKRFSFIADERVISILKRMAVEEKKTMKQLLDLMLREQIWRRTGEKVRNSRISKTEIGLPTTKNQQRLSSFLKGMDR